MNDFPFMYLLGSLCLVLQSCYMKKKCELAAWSEVVAVR